MKWQWDRFLSEFFGFLINIIPQGLFILIFHLRDEEKAR
jgi:F0F1-type ATP synthase assembly protein I